MQHWSEWEPLVDELRRLGRDKEADNLTRVHEDGALRTEADIQEKK